MYHLSSALENKVKHQYTQNVLCWLKAFDLIFEQGTPMHVSKFFSSALCLFELYISIAVSS